MPCLNIWIDGALVGEWILSRENVQSFRYDAGWIATGHGPLSHSLPISAELEIHGPAVGSYFDNLLPERTEKRKQLHMLFRTESEQPFSLLKVIGRDCTGAAQILPADEDPAKFSEAVAGDLTSDEVESMLEGLSESGMGVVREDTPVCATLSGAQDKTTLQLNQLAWRAPYALSAATHIFKPAIGILGNGIDLSKSVENEHLCMRLTAALGLPTANTSMKTFGSIRTLVVERFDRRWTRDKRLLRLPQEDLCQALGVPPSRKYQSDGGPGIHEALQFLKASDDPQADRCMFMKAQIVYWLLGATDGHAKNFSIFLYPGSGFRLTPLYDVMSLQPAFATQHIKRNRMKLAMSVGDQRHYVLDTIQPRHFVQSAQRAGMPVSDVETVFGEIMKAAPKANEILRDGESGIPTHIRRAILEGFKGRLALIESHGS